MIINHYTTAGIMCSRHNRHGFFREIYPQPEQFFINHREMLANKIGGLMADVEEHTIRAEAFHLMVNGAGDNIARRDVYKRQEQNVQRFDIMLAAGVIAQIERVRDCLLYTSVKLSLRVKDCVTRLIPWMPHAGRVLSSEAPCSLGSASPA